MLKRSRTDDDIEHAVEDATVLVVNDDADSNELIARLVESAGWTAERVTDLAGAAELVEAGADAVVIDSLKCGIGPAIELLEQLRGLPDEDANQVAIVLLASSDANRIFAYQAGADAFVVRPFHADDLVVELRTVLSASADERADIRRSHLMGGATTA